MVLSIQGIVYEKKRQHGFVSSPKTITWAVPAVPYPPN